MEQYVKYLRKSRFDRDYAEMSMEETLKRHEAILDKLAKDRGYFVSRTYYEVVSGESIAARPEIQKLLDEVSAGIYAGVLVVDLERLARGNGADQGYISQVFQYSGTKIITPSKTYDPCNEFDEEYFEFGLFMSRREYKTINRRLIRGRDSSASEGKWISSMAPYGYKRVKIEGEKGYTLEVIPEEAQWVQKVFELYAQGQGTKLIANYLNDRNVPTRKGDIWNNGSIQNMITNVVYMGKIRRGWSKTQKSIENGKVVRHIKRTKNMDEYQIFDGLHPALVSEEIYMACQRIRLEKQPAPKTRTSLDLMNPFAGLLFCAECGKTIERTKLSAKQGGQPRARCTNMRNCHNSTAAFELVETEIVEALKAWLVGYKVKLQTVGYADDIAANKKQIQKIDAEIKKLQGQLMNAYDLVEQGIYSKDIFISRRSVIQSSITSAEEKKTSVAEVLRRLEIAQNTQDSLIPQTERLLGSYDFMTNEERNALLKEIVQKIEYKKTRQGAIEVDLYPHLPKM